MGSGAFRRIREKLLPLLGNHLTAAGGFKKRGLPASATGRRRSEKRGKRSPGQGRTPPCPRTRRRPLSRSGQNLAVGWPTRTVGADEPVQPLLAALYDATRAHTLTQRAGGQVTRVFVLDDQEFVRRSLKEMLEAGGHVEVVGETGTARRRGRASR
jgi:hypothetical protein